MAVHRVPAEESTVADRQLRESNMLINVHVAAARAASVAARVQEDDERQPSAVWLSVRSHDFPIMWWSSEPTTLGALAPVFVQGLVARADQSNTDRCYTRCYSGTP